METGALKVASLTSQASSRVTDTTDLTEAEKSPGEDK
jgi:hypothetical protein